MILMFFLQIATGSGTSSVSGDFSLSAGFQELTLDDGEPFTVQLLSINSSGAIKLQYNGISVSETYALLIDL